MGVTEPRKDAHRQRTRPLRGQRGGQEGSTQGHPAYEFHHNEVGISVYAEIVNDHDVGMVERADSPRLAFESLKEPLITRQGVR